MPCVPCVHVCMCVFVCVHVRPNSREIFLVRRDETFRRLVLLDELAHQVLYDAPGEPSSPMHYGPPGQTHDTADRHPVSGGTAPGGHGSGGGGGGEGGGWTPRSARDAQSIGAEYLNLSL